MSTGTHPIVPTSPLYPYTASFKQPFVASHCAAAMRCIDMWLQSRREKVSGRDLKPACSWYTCHVVGCEWELNEGWFVVAAKGASELALGGVVGGNKHNCLGMDIV